MAGDPNAPVESLSFETHPSEYKHLQLEVNGSVARISRKPVVRGLPIPGLLPPVGGGPFVGLNVDET